ncbi:MAG: hypothetical protein QOF76_2981 [Solirubrobacteraceae bacterium]|nr:hypothetical protein [Solirubrobacteraceae bacterium]
MTDEFVGVVHGVMARIAPGARVIDISHGVPRHDILAGALTLERALPYMPAGVHLAVVDPEVGARRRAIAIRTADEGRLLVGPDNGLLLAAAERLGGCVAAVDVSRSPWRLEPLSATFHGRDVFGPVAAHLAKGADLESAGDPIEIDELVRLERPHAVVADDGSVLAHALSFDTFGNVTLDLAHADLARTSLRLGRQVEIEVGGRVHTGHYAHTFSDVPLGALVVYEDPVRALAIAVSSGDAAQALGVRSGDEIRLRAA